MVLQGEGVLIRRGVCGGGGGGGGALLIYSTCSFRAGVTGIIDSDGGNGGNIQTNNGGYGGGGSGGGIILQSRNVTLTATILSAVGGTVPVGGTTGDGGEGRVRVDGLVGATNIPGGLTSEFVGPAITSTTTTNVIGRAGASLWVNATIVYNGVFTTFESQSDANGDFQIPITITGVGEHYITVIQNTTNTIFVMSSAATAIIYVKKITDSAFVQDVLRATTTKPIFDSVNAEDDIITIGIRVGDDVGSADDIVYKAPATFDRKDSATINDVLRARTTKPIFDSAIVNDNLLATPGQILRDSATVNDVLRARTTKLLKDSATVNDVLRARTTIVLKDSATVNDVLIPTQGKILRDSATVNDVLRARTTKPIFDSASVNDVLRSRTTIVLKDSATVNDVLIPTQGKILRDSATV